MIPEGLSIDLELVEDIETTKTYKISKASMQGFADELEALKQAIYKVLHTEKYEYPIYSFSYGIELENLIGKDATYVKIELKRRVQECLLEDERIQAVDNFNFFINGDEMTCTFDVVSIYGSLSLSKEVVF